MIEPNNSDDDDLPAMSVASGLSMTSRLVLIELRGRLAHGGLGLAAHGGGLVLVAALIWLLFGNILQRQIIDQAAYAANIGFGLAVWVYILNSLSGCSTIAVRWSTELRFTNTPAWVYAFMINSVGLVLLVGGLVILYLVQGIAFGNWERISLVSALGIGIVFAAATGMGMLCTIAAIRFRDIPQIMSFALQIGFLLSPILWPDYFLGRFAYLLDFNPLYWLIEVIRGPLTGQAVGAKHWILAALFASALLAAGITVMQRYQNRLRNWF